MQKESVSQLVKALNDAGARYLIAGGLAVVAHGYVRLTADVDVILDMDEANLRKALRALAGLGYRPRAPVPIDDFALTEKRAQWVREKGLTVFSLYSSKHPATEVDLFMQPPVDFSSAYARAVRQEIVAGVMGVFVGFEDLVAMKELAARPRDREDIEKLKKARAQIE